jgi:dienelactone hydrolase
VAAGVKPAHIALIGFSKGGQITAYAGDRLSGLGLNIALMGICDNGDFHPDPPLRLGGKLLSLYGPLTEWIKKAMDARGELVTPH